LGWCVPRGDPGTELVRVGGWKDLNGTRSVPTAFIFFDLGGEGVEGGGGDAEAGESEDGAVLLAEAFGIAGGGPERFELFDLVAELSRSQVDGKAFLLFDVAFRWGGQDFGEPVVDAGDDLADAGLRDFEVFGDAVGGEEFNRVLAVDFEVAGGRWGRRMKDEGRRANRGGHWGLPGIWFQVPGFTIQVPGNRLPEQHWRHASAT
jgi:hypothetical protein